MRLTLSRNLFYLACSYSHPFSASNMYYRKVVILSQGCRSLKAGYYLYLARISSHLALCLTKSLSKVDLNSLQFQFLIRSTSYFYFWESQSRQFWKVFSLSTSSRSLHRGSAMKSQAILCILQSEVSFLFYFNSLMNCTLLTSVLAFFYFYPIFLSSAVYSIQYFFLSDILRSCHRSSSSQSLMQASHLVFTPMSLCLRSCMNLRLMISDQDKTYYYLSLPYSRSFFLFS